MTSFRLENISAVGNVIALCRNFSGHKNAKSPSVRMGSSLNWCLAVPYSHMGRPHTTIGATAFHFWVRHGVRWDHRAVAARQILFNLYQAENLLSNPPKHLRRCKVKPHGSLVPVSSTHRCAYTPGLSTSSSSTFLQDSQGVRENSSRGKFRA